MRSRQKGGRVGAGWGAGGAVTVSRHVPVSLTALAVSAAAVHVPASQSDSRRMRRQVSSN